MRAILASLVLLALGGCAIWLSLLLMNEEFSAPGLDLIVPDITKPCTQEWIKPKKGGSSGCIFRVLSS